MYRRHGLSGWTESSGRQHCVCGGVERVKENFSLFQVHSISVFIVPSEPLLCKFADGGQKKRQSQNKFGQNGRAWTRDGDSRLVSWGSGWS